MTTAITTTEQLDKTDVATETNKKVVAAADSASNASIMTSVAAGYGQTLDRTKISSLTRQASSLYGGDIRNLVYPADLITNQNGYNGLYTVFFISEHPQSSISQMASKEKKTIGSVASNTANSNIINDKWLKSETNTVGANLLAGLAATKGMSAVIDGTIGSVLPNSIAGTATDVAKTLTFIPTATAMTTRAFKGTVEIAKDGTNYNRLSVAIALPTPIITDQHTFSWDEQEAWMGTAAMQIAGKISDGVKNFDISSLGNSLSNVFQADSFGDLAEVAIMRTANEGAGTTLSRRSGKAANPRKEQIFKDVQMRSFQMKWKLAARSAEEQQNIESIIRVLKYHAYPEMIKDGYMWIYPAHFDIIHYFKNNVNTHMPRHATSVLKSIQVDYSGGHEMAVHNDGSPVIVDLSLEFVEIAVLSRSDISKGY